MVDLTDKELIERFRQGNNENYIFNLIIRKYQERLYWQIRKILISHEDSDDALQNTFIKAYENLKNFREESSLYTWLFRIATNEALLLLKKRKRKYILPLTNLQSQLEEALVSDSYCNGDEMQMKLQKAILTLPEKQRIVFNMKYFDDMKYEEIAEILNTSVGALKASYHHAIKKIEKFLESG